MADEYKSIANLKTAEDLCGLLGKLRASRHRKEIDWKLNLAYYRGQQFTYWNPASKRIESLPTEEGEKPRYRVRIVSNQIVTGTQSLLSKIVKTKPIFGATPGQPGTDAVKAAEFSEVLLEAWWRKFELSSKYVESNLWAIHCGSGYMVPQWDAFANKAMKFLLGPDGQPITDEAVAMEFRTQLEKMGIEPQEKYVYMGDLRVDVVSPFHVFGDPTSNNAHEWRWVIVQENLDVDEAKARYGVDLQPDAVAATPDQIIPFGNAENASSPNVVKTYKMFVLPSAGMPKGRYVCFTESGGAQILHDKPWPWEGLTTLPICQFTGIKIPGAAEGDAITTNARPLQKQLNRMMSQITEYFNLVVRPQWIAPYQSMKQRLTNEPGVVWEYNPVGATNLKPEPVVIPGIPSSVFEFMADITGKLREAYGLTEVTEGQLPPNLEAADAIDLLQEMATDRFVPTIEANEHALARLGQIMLFYAQKYYIEPRLLQIRGFGGVGSVKQFTRADFGGDISVHVEAGSSLPRTRAARRQQIEKWVAGGLIEPHKAWRYYDIADIKDVAIDYAMDQDQALREHEKMIQGVPLNPEAVQLASAAVSAGQNPDTGQQIQTPQEAQSILQKAALQPKLPENLQAHLDEHKKYINSLEFESHPADVRQRFYQHYELTLHMFMSLPQIVAPMAPKVSLQLRESVGPSTIAQVLKRAGVPEADPQTLGTEAPMENMIVDSVDKPDADAAGPGQEANQLSQAAQTVLAAETANAQAGITNAMNVHKHVQDTFAQQDKTKHTATEHAQKIAQDGDLHAAKLRKAQAEADLAEKKTRESSFKPTKPTRPAKKKGSRG